MLSPGNTEAEMGEKVALDFDAEAKEVWTCADSGVMRFYAGTGAQPLAASRVCPEFPREIELR